MMPYRCFVSGTDTGVGKTYVAASLLRGVAQRGQAVAGIKVVETGVEHPSGIGADARALATAAGHAPICFASFGRPVAPSAAARLADKHLDVAELASRVEHRAAGFDFVLAEGAGGLLVPLNERETMLDLARLLDWPVLLVAANRLGTINHALLSLEALRARRLAVAAVVLSYAEGGEPAQQNAEEIRRFGGAPVFLLGRDQELSHAAVDEILSVTER
jgi:dethiobiotin synthase